MSNLYITPVLVSAAVVLATYLMKKDELDSTKKPNYFVLFIVCLCISGGVVYISSSGEDSINLVMKEIDIGECPF